MRSTEDAKRDLGIALKHIRFAVEEARKAGTARLGVLSVRDDGGGKIECKLDCDFIEDVALLIGAPDLTDADRTECRANKFMAEHGLQRS